jgi:hypothetical protein
VYRKCALPSDHASARGLAGDGLQELRRAFSECPGLTAEYIMS